VNGGSGVMNRLQASGVGRQVLFLTDFFVYWYLLAQVELCQG